MKLNFEYSMRVDYTEAVKKCYFTLKCLPKETLRQKSGEVRVNFFPAGDFSYIDEPYGNKKIIGSINTVHDCFYVTVCGSVYVDGEGSFGVNEEKAVYEHTGIFKYPHGKTVMGAELRKYCDEIANAADFSGKSEKDKALWLMDKLYNYFEYAPASTDVTTGCEEAFINGKGVCQDYSHIFIAMCRYFGIPARYVTGIMVGEGQTHAWVEVLVADYWVGFDVTNNCLVNCNYIKFADGRDAMDCKVNFGVIIGGGNQTQTISAKVWVE